jgi:hypothetical protein
MIGWTSIVAGGLFISMLGIYFTFISKPPTEELAEARKTAIERGREMMEGMAEQSLLKPDQIRAAGEKAAQKEEQKLKFSVTGVRLLFLGAAVQLIGTIGQVVFLACKN